jgi:hypothetical protein
MIRRERYHPLLSLLHTPAPMSIPVQNEEDLTRNFHLCGRNGSSVSGVSYESINKNELLRKLDFRITTTFDTALLAAFLKPEQ